MEAVAIVDGLIRHASGWFYGLTLVRIITEATPASRGASSTALR